MKDNEEYSKHLDKNFLIVVGKKEELSLMSKKIQEF